MTNRPNYKGDGIAVWEGETMNGKKKLSIKLAGHTVVYAYETEDEPKKNNAVRQGNSTEDVF